MARQRRDGQPPRKPNRRNLTEKFIERLRPDERQHFLVWDERVRGLVLIVYTTGAKVWRVIYSQSGRARWYTIGRYAAIRLDDARRLASEVLLKVSTGSDPQAERMARRGQLTFEELADRYLEQHAKRVNKAWKKQDRQVRRHLTPTWGKLKAASITRADVKAAIGKITSPSVANLTLASASAIFSFAVKEELVATNPCQLVDGHELRSRERVLSDSEIPVFWKAFDAAGLLRGTALKLILLLGQRPGEVLHLHRTHVKDGWWEMPGKPVAELKWLGTKNKMNHRVWLPKIARDLLDEADGDQPFARIIVSPAMQAICKDLEAERATPHDLRRTHGTLITSLGFGRECMNRIQNHKEGGVGSVYDRYEYSEENKRVMEAVANKIVGLINGNEDENVIVAAFGR